MDGQSKGCPGEFRLKEFFITKPSYEMFKGLNLRKKIINMKSEMTTQSQLLTTDL